MARRLTLGTLQQIVGLEVSQIERVYRLKNRIKYYDKGTIDERLLKRMIYIIWQYSRLPLTRQLRRRNCLRCYFYPEMPYVDYSLYPRPTKTVNSALSPKMLTHFGAKPGWPGVWSDGSKGRGGDRGGLVVVVMVERGAVAAASITAGSQTCDTQEMSRRMR